jgi:NAD+ synthase
MTGMKVKALSMPIRQLKFQDDLSKAHLKWLKNKFFNVDEVIINLDEVFNSFEKTLGQFNNELAFANSRARLRMATLYQVAGANNGIVVGTGNKIEDFGVGFFTKYGDGGVDISPIADCLKSQVWEMGKELKILEDIINAAPTDGLWSDGRTDERQLGMSYEDLEKAMLNSKDKNYEKYLKIRKRNLHKMNLIPICKFNNNE